MLGLIPILAETLQMRYSLVFLTLTLLLCACKDSLEHGAQQNTSRVVGTWKLQTGTVIEKGDTTITDYRTGKEFIKIINDSHFAFLMHDFHKGKDADSVFVAGGGDYTLTDSSYTEHLVYCSDRQWEGNSFHFTLHIDQDTLVETGIEKVDSLGINRLNMEKYIRVRK
jgi:hypothetical protein